MEEQKKIDGFPQSDKDQARGADDKHSTTGDGHPNRRGSTTGDGHDGDKRGSTTGDGHPPRK